MGWSGTLFRPLLLRGELPNLASVIERGVYGKLQTLAAPNCPKVYTAIATSAAPEENGITGFEGTLGGTGSRAFGINDTGQVVGDFYLPGDSAAHAFCTAPNSPINPATDDLGTLGGTSSLATGINTAGQVVGGSSLTAGNNIDNHAFLYSGGTMYDLNDLIPNGKTQQGMNQKNKWTLSYAWAINDAGQIVGQGAINGETHAFRLDPVGRNP